MFSHNSRYAVTLLLFLVISFGCSKKSEGLVQQDVPQLVNGFLSMHVSKNEFNDEISERTLDNIISSLDPWKMYFTKSDIDVILKDKDKLDEYHAEENYQFLFNIFTIYKKRFDERYRLYEELIKQDYDFTVDESIPADKDTITWTDDTKEISERWRKSVKLQLLSYINTGKSPADAKKKVAKRQELNKKENDSMNNDRIYKAYVNAFGRALDPHSDYMDRDEFDDFKIQMGLKLQGIGAVLRSEDGFVFVESIMPGGPVSKLPEETKILPNDKIIAVAQGSSEPEDVIDIPLRDAVKKIRGKKGTTVKLTIVREIEKGKPRTIIIPIVRDEIILEQAALKSDVYEKQLNGKTVRIGYIKLPTFYNEMTSFTDTDQRTSGKDMLDAIKALSQKKINAMVVDLRQNPGGALEDAIRISGFFIKTGPVVQVMEHGRVNVKSDTDADMNYDGPVVILIDKLSASASEIVAGAMKDYRRALLLGSTTFGKGSVQTLIPLGGSNGAIKTTIQLFYQPSGNSNHLNGVKPDIVIGDITDLLDFGENKLKYPLKWEPIPASKYQPYTRYLNPSIVSSLTAKSRSRMKADQDFIKLNTKMDKYRKQLAEKTISLKKDTSGDIAEEMEQQQKDKESREKNNKLIDTQKDIFLREAFNITADYAEILGSGK